MFAGDNAIVCGVRRPRNDSSSLLAAAASSVFSGVKTSANSLRG